VQSFSGPSPVGLVAIFYCLRFETSLFVASYNSQGYGGGIRPRLHTGLITVRQLSPFYNFGANGIEITTCNSSSAIVCLSVAVETCVKFVATLWFLQAYPLPRIRVLGSRCLGMDVSAVLLWLHTSGVQASCHNIKAIHCYCGSYFCVMAPCGCRLYCRRCGNHFCLHPQRVKLFLYLTN
jgi:hypothetical protein